jgi:hypothetical protein
MSITSLERDVSAKYHEILDYNFIGKFLKWLDANKISRDEHIVNLDENDISLELTNIDNTFSNLRYDGFKGIVIIELDLDDFSAAGRYASEKGIEDDDVDTRSIEFETWYKNEFVRELKMFVENEKIKSMLSYLKRSECVVEIVIEAGNFARRYYAGTNKPYVAVITRYWNAMKKLSKSNKDFTLIAEINKVLLGMKKKRA